MNTLAPNESEHGDASASSIADAHNEAAEQYLTFELGGEVYGIGILTAREIIDYGDLTQVPMMPDFIEGVINLRGSVVPVVNLALRFQVTPGPITKKTSIVIIEIEEEGAALVIGLVVDEVREVLDLKEDQIQPPPTLGAKIRTDFIQGMGKVNNRFMILLDVSNVVSIAELSQVQPGTQDETPARSVDGETDHG